MDQNDFNDDQAKRAFNDTKKALDKTGGRLAKKGANRAGNLLKNKLKNGARKLNDKIAKKIGPKAQSRLNQFRARRAKRKNRRLRQRLRKLKRRVRKAIVKALAKLVAWFLKLLWTILPYLAVIAGIIFFLAWIGTWITEGEYNQKYLSYNYQEENTQQENPFNIDRDGNYVTQAKAMSKGNKMYFVYYAYNAQKSFYVATVDKNGKAVNWNNNELASKVINRLGAMKSNYLLRGDDRYYQNVVASRLTEDTKNVVQNFTMNTNMLYLLDQSLNKPSLSSGAHGFLYAEQITKPMYTGDNFNYKQLVNTKTGKWNAKSWVMDTEYSPKLEKLRVQDKNGNEQYNPSTKDLNNGIASYKKEAEKKKSSLSATYHGSPEQYLVYQGPTSAKHPYPYKQDLSTIGWSNNGKESTSTGDSGQKATSKEEQEIKDKLNDPKKNLTEALKKKWSDVQLAKSKKDKAISEMASLNDKIRPILPNLSDFDDTTGNKLGLGHGRLGSLYEYRDYSNKISAKEKELADKGQSKKYYAVRVMDYDGDKYGRIWRTWANKYALMGQKIIVKDKNGNVKTDKDGNPIMKDNPSYVSWDEYLKKHPISNQTSRNNASKVIYVDHDFTLQLQHKHINPLNKSVPETIVPGNDYQSGFDEAFDHLHLGGLDINTSFLSHAVSVNTQKELDNLGDQTKQISNILEKYNSTQLKHINEAEKTYDNELSTAKKRFDNYVKSLGLQPKDTLDEVLAELNSLSDSKAKEAYMDALKDDPSTQAYAIQEGAPNTDNGKYLKYRNGVWNYGFGSIIKFLQLPVSYGERVEDPKESASDNYDPTSGIINVSKEASQEEKKINSKTSIKLAVFADNSLSAKDLKEIDDTYLSHNAGFKTSHTGYTVNTAADFSKVANNVAKDTTQAVISFGSTDIQNKTNKTDFIKDVTNGIKLLKNKNKNMNITIYSISASGNDSEVSKYNSYLKEVANSEGVNFNSFKDSKDIAQNIANDVQKHQQHLSGNANIGGKNKAKSTDITQAKKDPKKVYVVSTYKDEEGTKNNMRSALAAAGFHQASNGYWYKDTLKNHNEYFLSGATTPIGSVDFSKILVKVQEKLHKKSPNAGPGWHEDSGQALKKQTVGKTVIQEDLTDKAKPDKDGIKYQEAWKNRMSDGSERNAAPRNSSTPMSVTLVSDAPQIDSDTWKKLTKELDKSLNTDGVSNIHTQDNVFNLHGMEYFVQYMMNYETYAPDKVVSTDKTSIVDQVNLIENGSVFETDADKKQRYDNLAKLFDQSVTDSGKAQDGEGQTVGGDASSAETIQKYPAENVKKFAKFFENKGLSGIAIAGIMGNIAQESGFRPDASSGNADIGLIQWTGPAMAKLKSWSASHGKNYLDIDAQLEYLWSESNSARTANGVGHNANLLKGLMNAKTPEEAATIWEQQVEGAGTPAMENRFKYAKAFYNDSTLKLSSIKGDSSKLLSDSGNNSADSSNAAGSDGLAGAAASLMDYAKGFLGNLSAGWKGDYDDPDSSNNNSGSDAGAQANADGANQMTFAGSIYRSMFMRDNWSNQRDVWTYDDKNNKVFNNRNVAEWNKYVHAGKNTGYLGLTDDTINAVNEHTSDKDDNLHKQSNNQMAMQNNGAQMYSWNHYRNNLSYDDVIDVVRAYLALLWTQNSRRTTFEDTPNTEAQLAWDLDSYMLNQFRDMYSPKGEMSTEDRLKKVISLSFGDTDPSITEKGTPQLASSTSDSNNKDSSAANLNKKEGNSDADTLTKDGSDSTKEKDQNNKKDKSEDNDAQTKGAEAYAAFNNALNSSDAKDVSAAGNFNGKNVVLETSPGEKVKSFNEGTVILSNENSGDLEIQSKQGGIVYYHNIDPSVKEKAKIKKGQVIGKVKPLSKLTFGLQTPAGTVADLNFSELKNGKQALGNAVKQKDYSKKEDKDDSLYVENDKTAAGQMIDPSFLFGSNDDDGSSASDILGYAKSWIGHAPYSQGGSRILKNHGDSSDCSGFIWNVLKHCGYKVPPYVWNTGFMEDDARHGHKYLKQVSASEAGPGDIIILNIGSGGGDLGHTAILEEKWHGNDTKIINEGGEKDNVNEDTFQRAFYSMIGHSSVTYARPMKG